MIKRQRISPENQNLFLMEILEPKITITEIKSSLEIKSRQGNMSVHIDSDTGSGCDSVASLEPCVSAGTLRSSADSKDLRTHLKKKEKLLKCKHTFFFKSILLELCCSKQVSKHNDEFFGHENFLKNSLKIILSTGPLLNLLTRRFRKQLQNLLFIYKGLREKGKTVIAKNFS